MKTRPIDFNFRCVNVDGERDITAKAVHTASPLNYTGPEFAQGTLGSGSSIQFTVFENFDTEFKIFGDPGDFTSEITEMEFTGPAGYNVGQLPSTLTKFKTEHRNAIMGGDSLPEGLVDLSVLSLNSALDADRIISALEVNGQTNGYLKLGDQVSAASTDILTSRGWTVEVEPAFAAQLTQSQAPHTYYVNGKPRHKVNRKRFGDLRQQRFKRALTFNGTSEHAELNGFATPTGSFTVSLWHKGNAIPPNDGGIIGKWKASGNQRSFLISIDGITGHLLAYQSADGTASISRIVESDFGDGVWRHITVVFSAELGFPTIYVDGAAAVMAGSGTAVGNIYDSPAPLEIGRFTKSYVYASSCSVDDVRIFDTALPATEIRNLARQKPGQKPARISSVPLLHYKLDDPTTSPYIRNSGSLGSSGDAIITGTISNVRGTVSDRYCYANEVGHSPSFTTDGVNDYIDTQLTLVDITEFTVWRRARYLSTNGFDFDGFYNDGGEAIRIGRDNGNTNIYANMGDLVALTPGNSIPDNTVHTISARSRVGGSYRLELNGVAVSAGAATMSAFTGQNISYKIGAQQSTSGGVSHYGHVEYYEYLIADRVLSNAELTWLETGGESGTAIDFVNDPNILVYYNFKERSPNLIENLANPDLPGVMSVGGEWSAVDRDESDITKDITGRSLMFTGEAPRDPGILSPCVELNGTNEAITVPHSSAFTFGNSSSDLPFSVSAWVYVNSHGANKGAILAKAYDVTAGNCEWLLQMDDTGKPVFVLYDNASDQSIRFDGDDPVATNEWVHLVGTYDGSGSENGIKIYLNGVSITGTASENGTYVAMHSTTTAVTVGSSFSASIFDRWLDGSISDSKIFDFELSATQVLANYAGTLQQKPLLHLPMCEESGEWCWDVSGRGYHGSGAPTDRSGRQDFVDYPITNGWAKGTWYDGTNDYYQSSAVVVGGGTKLSISARFFCDGFGTVRVITSEYKGGGDERSWQLYVDHTGKLVLGLSSDGAGVNVQFSTTSRAIVIDKWYHVICTFDAGVVKFIVNGVEWTSSITTGSLQTSFYGSASELGIGARADAAPLPFSGILSQILITRDIAWSDAQALAITEANAQEIPALAKSFGGTSWFFRDGNGTEVIQSQALSEYGAPEARTILPSPKATYELEFVDQLFGRYVDLGWKLSETGDWEINLEFRINGYDASDPNSAILQQNHNSNIGRMSWQTIKADDSLSFFIDNDADDISIISAANTIKVGQWQTGRITRVDDTISVWVDDVLIGTDTSVGLTIAQANNFMLGSNDIANGDEPLMSLRNLYVVNGNDSYEYLTANVALPNIAESYHVDVVKTATVPIAYGPGKRAPLQEWLLDGDEANSPYALRYTKGVSVPYEVREKQVFTAVGQGYVDLGAQLIHETNNFDISCVFRKLGNAGDAATSIISQYTAASAGRCHISLANDGTLSLFVDGATDINIASAAGKVISGPYYRVRATRIGDTFALYLDDELIGTQTQAGISVQAKNTFLWNNDPSFDQPWGNIMDVVIISGSNRYEYLREGIGLPGATLTGSSIIQYNDGIIANDQVFATAGGGVNVYEEPMNSDFANLIARGKKYRNSL